MDFMRTLLAYMAATLLVAVESTATPGPAPTPSPIPEGVTTPAIVETITEAPTETPEPTVSVTPVPVPTITANTKAYHNLAQGAKGAEVRKLQEKLIELGYLPEGAADGAYGGQTRNAVRRFQYYNSLTVDGVAGRITQTNLFENPDIVPMPTATPSPTPTGTPEPTPTAEPTETPAPEGTETTEAPAEATEEPTEETEAPAEVTEEPAEETEVPAKETEEPAEETEAPAEVTEEPADETEAPAEATEEPAEETEAPTEATEEPAEEVTEAPADATEEPTKETEAPAEETEAPADATEEPTKETEAPADATEEPADAENTAEPEIVEHVNLDDTYQEINASIVLNDSGAPMEWLALEDGVSVKRKPRILEREGNFRISLADVVQCVDGWELTDDGSTVVLQAAGYTLGLYNESAGIAATVDGIELEINPQEYDFSTEGNFIDAAFLCRALSGSCEWDGEEFTLMLRIPNKDVSKATD